MKVQEHDKTILTWFMFMYYTELKRLQNINHKKKMRSQNSLSSYIIYNTAKVYEMQL